MLTVVFDTETHLIEPGRLAPKLVCMTWATDGGPADIVDAEGAVAFARAWLLDPTVRLVGHNVAFDLAVLAEQRPSLLPLIFDAYSAGRISDTMIREKLLMLAEGRLSYDFVEKTKPGFSLAACARRHLGLDLAKGVDTWRLRYSELDGVPLADWPDEALLYALGDATTTRDVWLAQGAQAERDGYLAGPGVVVDERPQARAAWALHLMSCWGLRTDPGVVVPFLATLAAEQIALDTKLEAAGLMRWTGPKKAPKLSRNMAEFQRRCAEGYAARGGQAPMTPSGRVSTSAETLRNSGDPDLVAYADESGAAKILSTWGDYLRLGTHSTINHGYSLLMETGRTSAYRPNTQNPHRRGALRECFVPRAGCVYVGADYSYLELCTLAQSCIDRFGESELAVAINDGLDPHLHMAALLLGVPYDDAVGRYVEGDGDVKAARQLAKAANFGLPGGMGAESFAAFAMAGYRIAIPEHYLAREKGGGWHLKNLWLDRWPEMRQHFAWVSELDPFGNPFTLTLPRSGRRRGGCAYTAGCNNLFQGPAADGAKAALFALARRCYGGDLDGCRPVMFIHDEVIVEVPRAMVTTAARALEATLVSAMRVECPDVQIRAEAYAMARWYKGAEPVWIDGELVPWEPSA